MAEPSLDRFQMREIEMQLTNELHVASERLRLAGPTERQEAADLYHNAMQAFKDFCIAGVAPERLLPASRKEAPNPRGAQVARESR